MITTILLGPPGSGKGTQTEQIVRQYGLLPIMPGCLMREHIRKGTDIGKKLANYINEGLLAPHDITLNLVEAELKTASKKQCALLFDGFPRAISQALALDELLIQYGHRLASVLLLDVPEAIIKDRIKQRALILGRSDDQNDEKVAKRLGIYQQETLQVVNHYKKQNKLHRVQAVGSIAEVFERITKVLDIIYGR